MANPLVIQEAQTSVSSSGTTISIELPSPVTEGSAIHLIGYANTDSAITAEEVTFSDNNGNDYSLGTVDVTSDGSGVYLFHTIVLNANAGLTTFTVTFSETIDYTFGIWAREIGPTATGSLDNHTGIAITAGTSTPSGSLTINNSGGALISAVGADWNTNQAPSAGSGYTYGIAGQTAGGYYPNGNAASESEFFSSSGTQTVSFGIASPDIFTILAASFAPSSSGQPPTITAQPVNDTVAPSSPATFSVAATDADEGADITYQWYYAPTTGLFGAPGAWNAISGATSASYESGDLSASNNGDWYYVVCTNGIGSTQSALVRSWLTGQTDQGLGQFELGWPKARRGRDLRPGSDSWTRLYPQFGYTSGNQAGAAIANDYFFAATAPSGTLAGSVAITFAADGTLTATGALAGTTATTVGANATLTASGALAGSAAITFAASATATLPGLEGTTAITIGATGTLTAVGTLSAAAAITFAASADLIGEGALTGASAITFAADGTLTATGVLLGTTSTTFTAAGALTAMGALAGAASATFGASATAEGAGALQGTTDLSFAATGTLTQPGLSGSTGLSIGVSASLEGAGALAGEAGITFGASGTLIQPGLSGTTGLTFSAAGTVAGRGALLGSASVSLGAAGTVSGIGTLAGTTAASMSASATLTGVAAATGTCSLTMTASGLLSGAGTLAGMSAMVFSGQGTLEGLAALSGLTSIQFEASASPGTAGAISGTTGMSFALVGQIVALLQGDPGYFLAAPPFMSIVTAQKPITTITAPPFTSSVTAD